MRDNLQKSPGLKRIVFISLVLAQVILLAGIIYTKHTWIRDGQKVLLRTEPVDPRSLLRGDYVRLSYDIEDIDLLMINNTESFVRGEDIYIGLEVDDKGISSAVSVSHEPLAMPFIRGRVKYARPGTHKEITVRTEAGSKKVFPLPRFAWMFDDDNIGDRYELCLSKETARMVNSYRIYESKKNKKKSECRDDANSLIVTLLSVRKWEYPQVRVDFTIDSYFVEEDTGLEIEKQRNKGNVLVEAALRDDGMPLISALIINGVRIK